MSLIPTNIAEAKTNEKLPTPPNIPLPTVMSQLCQIKTDHEELIRDNNFDSAMVLTPPLSYSITTTPNTTAPPEKTALNEIRVRFPLAAEFWEDNFDNLTVVAIDRFMFALEMFNDDQVKLPAIKLDEMDINMFKSMMGNKAIKQLFSKKEIGPSPAETVECEIPQLTEQLSSISVKPIATPPASSHRSSFAEIKGGNENVLELLKRRNPVAHCFWVNNFLSPDSVSKDLFNLAIQLYNTKEVKIPTIEALSVDALLFNVLCNGPLKELFPII